MSPLSHRPATPEDAPTIAEVHVEAWRLAYAALLPEAFLAGLSKQKREQRWRHTLSDAPGSVILAVQEGTTVGWVSFGLSRDPDGAACGEIYALYVAPGFWRRGVGRSLMPLAEAAFQQRGYSQASLWVLEGNAIARPFYQRLGYAADGATQQVEIGGSRLTELRLRKPLVRA
jgi:ribosomal protein S18 acetylase RimI-like enzyme